MCPFMRRIDVHNGMDFCDFMEACKNGLRSAEMEFLVVVLWWVWSRRNGLVHKSVLIFEDEVIPWAEALLTDFRIVNAGGESETRKAPPVVNSWQPPDKGLSKVNTDAVVDGSHGNVGVGIFIRNNAGDILGSSSQPFNVIMAADMAEALAIFRGLIFAMEAWLFPCVVESDAQVSGLSSVVFAPRLANKVAHCMAKFGVSLDGPLYWLDEALSWFSPIIMDDRPQIL
ncbi:hypothetical protein Ddye_021954 [Dipteronia dyeriana]|uniref:RNase H type-1 domain-containing protein n=1 Tax=Dipteronia dyeriana TaxID=168575 RepID=A0AAD9U3M1_9ROSI|nr:hypothetical protein Ddye_021954 [Dipteronia dyeriana]